MLQENKQISSFLNKYLAVDGDFEDEDRLFCFFSFFLFFLDLE